MKPRATLDEQIVTLRKRGVTFNEMSEEKARSFLTYNSYYYKLKSYENNYPKNGEDDNYKYVGLDFAYLVELSLIDFALSRLVRSLCSNIEHSLKVDLNRKIMEDDDPDIALKCVSACFPHLPPLMHDNPYTNDLVAGCHNEFAPWHLWELLSLSDQIRLYETYFKLKNKELPEKQLLFIMRKMRNAVSHGNCLFANMGRPTPTKMSKSKKSDTQITNAAMKMCGRRPKRGSRKSSLQIALDRLVVNNYAAVLICHLSFVNSTRTLYHARNEVQEFIERVNRKRPEYFGSLGQKEPRNKLIDSTLEALVVLSNSYIARAEEKEKTLEKYNAYLMQR